MNYSETNTIEKVREYSDHFELTHGLCCILEKKHGVTPKAGDELTIHTVGSRFGTIRGMDINGVPVFWLTDEDLERQSLEWLANNQRKKEEQFEKNIHRMDSDYESLPEAFKKRIDNFRQRDPKFRVDKEMYELFCCTEAVKIAEACKTPEKVEKFETLPWEEHVKVVSDEHSGNTFRCSVFLAYWYLADERKIEQAPGSLSPITGKY